MATILSFYEGDTNPYKSILNDVHLVYPNILIFQVPINVTMTSLYNIKTNPTLIVFLNSSEHKRYEGTISIDDILTVLGEIIG